MFSKIYQKNNKVFVRVILKKGSFCFNDVWAQSFNNLDRAYLYPFMEGGGGPDQNPPWGPATTWSTLC